MSPFSDITATDLKHFLQGILPTSHSRSINDSIRRFMSAASAGKRRVINTSEISSWWIIFFLIFLRAAPCPQILNPGRKKWWHDPFTASNPVGILCSFLGGCGGVEKCCHCPAAEGHDTNHHRIELVHPATWSCSNGKFGCHMKNVVLTNPLQMDRKR